MKVLNLSIKVYHYYIVFVDPSGNTLYEKREGKGIWQGLYQFPLATSSAFIEIESVLTSNETGLDISLFENAKHFVYHDNYVVHKLTHRHIYATFIVVKTAVALKEGIPFVSIDQFPTAVLISDFIKAFKNSYFWYYIKIIMSGTLNKVMLIGHLGDLLT